MKKIISSMLAAVFCLGLLAGCAGSPAAGTEPEVIETETPVQETESVDIAAVLQEKKKIYDGQSTVMTVDGQDVNWDRYYYWLA